ncbi:MAG: radical SAM protein [Thermoanaerobaculia bacterium]
MAAYEPHPTVLWELTRLCDLHCRGCPSGANERRDPNELSTYDAYRTVDHIAALQPRELIISGGDPLEREDVYQIIDYARRRGLDPSLVLSPTRELTSDAIAKLQANGLTSVVFGVDRPIAPVALRWAESADMRIEINTLVTRRNMNELGAIVESIRPFRIARWNVHFVVPVGASRELEMISAAETERVFAKLDEIGSRETFALRVVEAPHYRRFRLERLLESSMASAAKEWGDFTGFVGDTGANMREVLDCALDGARSFVYITHAGEVRASEFAPHVAGNLRYRLLGDIYRGSDLFVALRDPDNLHGKCRACDYRTLCGGSRARAYAMTGNLLGSDPLCAYEPGRGG